MKVFGKLGIYLIDKARNKMINLNQLIVFQKAKIKKDNMNKIQEKSLKMKRLFIESRNQDLNNIMSTKLLQFKEDVLNLNISLLNDLKSELINIIRIQIEEKFSAYVEFLLSSIKNSLLRLNTTTDLILELNGKDFDYISNNIEKIKGFSDNNIEIKPSVDDFIGGFKIVIHEQDLSYDFTINSLIEKKSNIIEKEFSKNISDFEIIEVENNFERFIQSQKSHIEAYLEDYDIF